MASEARGDPGEHASRRADGLLSVTILTLYSKPGCHLCVDARDALVGLRAELGFDLCEVDITTDETLHRAYFERIPVVALDGEELFDYFVEADVLRERLRAIL